MERTDRKIRLCTALVVVNVLFIWGNSLLPGSVSGAISQWVRDMLAFLFGSGNENPDAGHGLLRKLAHFTEFSCLGALLAWLLLMCKKIAFFSLPVGFLIAGIDETIQHFVPGRGPSFTDVLIDTSGVLLGIVILLMGHTMSKNKAKQELEETTT